MLMARQKYISYWHTGSKTLTRNLRTAGVPAEGVVRRPKDPHGILILSALGIIELRVKRSGFSYLNAAKAFVYISVLAVLRLKRRSADS